MSRRKWIVVGIVLLLLVCGIWTVSSINSAGQAAMRAALTPTATAVSDSAVTAKGNIVPARYARLTFETSGTVAKVLVKEGGKVKAGDVLAQLDTGDLALQVQNAQDSLDIAAATLAQAKAAATADEIAAAEASYAQAQAEYDKAKNGPSGADLAILKANLSKAEAAVKSAQTAFDRAGGASNPMIGMMPQSLDLQRAFQDYDIAKANYELKTKVDAATLAAAEAAMYNAKAALDVKKNGARPADLAVEEARVRQAKTALAQAQAALAKASLTAPVDGTVTSVAVRQGEAVNASAPAVTIGDLSRMQIETTDLDEWGAARVRIDQPVKITVSAFQDKVLTGKVTNIAPESVLLSTGDVSYVVTVALDEQDPELRWGMTAKLEFAK